MLLYQSCWTPTELPIPMLDGDKLLQYFLEHSKPEYLRYIKYLRIFALTVLILNFIGSFIRFPSLQM